MYLPEVERNGSIPLQRLSTEEGDVVKITTPLLASKQQRIQKVKTLANANGGQFGDGVGVVT